MTTQAAKLVHRMNLVLNKKNLTSEHTSRVITIYTYSYNSRHQKIFLFYFESQTTIQCRGLSESSILLLLHFIYIFYFLLFYNLLEIT